MPWDRCHLEKVCLCLMLRGGCKKYDTGSVPVDSMRMKEKKI